MQSIPRRLALAFLALVVGCADSPTPGGPADHTVSSSSSSGDMAVVRVSDVGAGLCCVIKMPGSKFVIYDTGNYEDNGKTAMENISAFMPGGSTVDMLVLSHSDSDHVAAVPAICDKYHVKVAVFPDIDRDTSTWKDAMKALDREAQTDGCKEVRVKTEDNCEGMTVTSGEAEFRILCGWAVPPTSFECKDDSELKNGGSIIARFTCGGWSVLFTGDEVGRHLDSPPGTCIAEEKWLVEHVRASELESDVLIAPHHGANNASSERFLQAVHPSWVLFSAGHKFSHPRAATAERYLAAGVPKNHLLRTDRGDDEGEQEWNEGRIPGTKDSRGDDSITITIKQTNGSWTLDVEQQK